MEKDKRFAHVATDPRFRRMPKDQRKIKIDRRFQGMFTDNRFNVNYTLDKRGRPATYSSGENLKKFYECSSSDEDSGSEEEENDEESEITTGEEDAGDSDESEKKRKTKHENKIKAVESDRSKKHPHVRKKMTVSGDHGSEKQEDEDFTDYARGVGSGLLLSDSSSGEESEEDEEEEMIHLWGELNQNTETIEEATSRLAVCNLAWHCIKAKHIMMLLASFVPPGGVLHSVVIYPSEFGMQRLEEEEKIGPKELVQEKIDIDDCEDSYQEEQGKNNFEIEKLRDYEMKRLQYYYAVVTCDSVATAEHLYKECEGMEFEATANVLDLRFIPENMEFDQEPHDTCTDIMDASQVQWKYFCNQALQNNNVSLTWDETDPERKQLQQKVFESAEALDNDDLKIYLASGSSSDEEETDVSQKVIVSDSCEKEDDTMQNYRNLVLSLKEEEEKEDDDDVQMEVKWGIGLEEKTKDLVKKIEDKDKSPWEYYLEKRKEKKKQKFMNRKQQNQNAEETEISDNYFSESKFLSSNQKKKKESGKKYKMEEEGSEESKRATAELELLMMDEDSNKNHFSLKSILSKEKTKKKNEEETGNKELRNSKDKFQLNLQDPRFDALYTSHHFHVDPTHSNFRKTKGSKALLDEKQHRRNMAHAEPAPKKSRQELKQKSDAELSLLVKSVKNKTASFQKTRQKKL